MAKYILKTHSNVKGELFYTSHPKYTSWCKKKELDIATVFKNKKEAMDCKRILDLIQASPYSIKAIKKTDV